MFLFKKGKKEKEMREIKNELNKPLDGPLGPENRPVLDKITNIDRDEFGEELKTPSGIQPAIKPPYEPAPVPNKIPTAPVPVEPIKRASAPAPEEEMPAVSGEETPAPVPSDSGNEEAPLFIKVDKYSDLLAHIKEMKTFLKSFKQTLDVLREIETAKDDALKILRASANRLERVLETADQELLKSDMTEQVEAAGKEEAAHVEDTLQSLKSEIDSLKNELKRME